MNGTEYRLAGVRRQIAAFGDPLKLTDPVAVLLYEAFVDQRIQLLDELVTEREQEDTTQ